MIFDFFVSFSDINHCNLEAITIPVLIIHAADDPAAPYDAAQQATGRIPRARLLRVGKGGTNAELRKVSRNIRVCPAA